LSARLHRAVELGGETPGLHVKYHCRYADRVSQNHILPTQHFLVSDK